VAQIGKGAFATVWKARVRLEGGEEGGGGAGGGSDGGSGNNAEEAAATAATASAAAAAPDDEESAAAARETAERECGSAVDRKRDDGQGPAPAPPPPPSREVAVKVLNLESTETNLDEIRHEVHAMRLTSHPNLLGMHGAFLSGPELWLVTPLMRKGSSVSCLQLARRHYQHLYRQGTRRQGRREQLQSQEPTDASIASAPGGPVQQSSVPAPRASPTPPPPLPPPMEGHILYILRETVLGLKYLHDSHQIHRDVKGGNILLDCDGSVKLGDFGVSRIVQTGGSSLPILGRRASTFVGTPCWM
jgi:serine/threonine protein kinase